MSANREPKSPFVFHESEIFVGEGAFLRSHRRRLITLALLLAAVLGVIAALQVPQWIWRQSLDASVNLRTGLPDGAYVMDPTTSMHEGRDCWFRGPVRGVPDAAEITIAGSGLVQCAASTDFIGRVHFTVAGGEATIDRAAGY